MKELTVIFVLLFLFPLTTVFAQIASNYPQFPFQTWFSPEALATFLGVPSDWLVIPKVIYYVIVPFLVAVTVTYGILTELRIFRGRASGRVNMILSVAMAFLLLPSGILTIIVTYFYAANTFIGLIGFGILFLVGVIMWVYGTTFRLWGTYGSAKSIARDVHGLNRQIQQLEREIHSINEELNRTDNPNARQTLIDRRTRLVNEHATLMARRADATRHLQDLSA